MCVVWVCAVNMTRVVGGWGKGVRDVCVCGTYVWCQKGLEVGGC